MSKLEESSSLDPNLVKVKWETRDKILFKHLSDLRNKDIQTDVTLWCDDESFSAHRLILVMSSGYFARAFKNVSAPPLVVVCGIKARILQGIVNFIYDGTVTISSEDISQLLRAGLLLEIPGLMEMGSTITETNADQASPYSDSNDFDSVKDENEYQNESKQDFWPKKNVEEADSSMDTDAMSTSEIFCYDEPKGKAKSEFEGWLPIEIEKSGRRKEKKIAKVMEVEHTCTFCNRSFNKASGLKSHVTKSHVTKAHNPSKKKKESFDCLECGMQFESKASLLIHNASHEMQLTLNSVVTKSGRMSKPKKVFKDLNDTLTRPIRRKSNTNAKVKENFDKRLADPVNFLEVFEKRLPDNKRSSYGESDESKSTDSIDPFNAIDMSKSQILGDVNVTCIQNEENCKSPPSPKPSSSSQPEKVDLVEKAECSICDRWFDNVKVYNNHRITDCKILQCPICHENFTQDEKISFSVHMTTHGPESTSFQCVSCPFLTDASWVLDEHVSQQHSGKNDYMAFEISEKDF